MKTLKELAQNALDVQEACNPLGVTKGCAEDIQALRETLTALGQPDDTPAIRNHPIFLLWASAIHSLAGLGLSDFDRYRVAYEECEKLAKG